MEVTADSRWVMCVSGLSSASSAKHASPDHLQWRNVASIGSDSKSVVAVLGTKSIQTVKGADAPSTSLVISGMGFPFHPAEPIRRNQGNAPVTPGARLLNQG